MDHNYRDINQALPSLMTHVLGSPEQDSRNGRTREALMQQIVLHDPDRYEIYAPGRNASLPAQIAETMWVLAGRNDIGWLSHYLPRAADFADDGRTWRAGYGPRIRNWYDHDGSVDQLAHVVELLKADPNSRRAVISLYHPYDDTKPGKDIACNNWLHFIGRDGELHLHVATRSNDLMWGWSGINAFEWTVLLNVVAQLTGMQRGSVTFAISSLHLYEPYWAKAERIADHEPPPAVKPSPQFSYSGTLKGLDNLIAEWFRIEGLIREDHGNIRDIISRFEEPMMRSWLWALYYWHLGDVNGFGSRGYAGTAIEAALLASPKLKREVKAGEQVGTSGVTGIPQVAKDFTAFASALHADKHAAYGDSWKKRGEMLSIMSNVARKIDRLGIPGGGDTSADSAIDLLVYLVKYELWLSQRLYGIHGDDLTEGEAHVAAVASRLENLQHYSQKWQQDTDAVLINELKGLFETLYPQVEEKRITRDRAVQNMIEPAYLLALSLWNAENRAEHEKAQRDQVRESDPFGDGMPQDRGGKLHVETTTVGTVVLFPATAFGDGNPAAHAELVQSLADRNATRRWNPEAGL